MDPLRLAPTPKTDRRVPTLQALSMEQVCRFTGLGRTFLNERIARGDLVARKAGRRTLVLAADLQAFLDALPKVTS